MRKSLLFSAVAATAIVGNANEVAYVAKSNVANNMVAKNALCERISDVKSSNSLTELTPAQYKAYKMKAAAAGAAGAYYERPKGLVYAGLSLATYSLKNTFLVGTPYSVFDWTNLSSDFTSSSWKYSVGVDASGEDEFSVSTDNVITTTYPYGMYTAPALNAVNAVGDSTYMAVKYLNFTANGVSNTNQGRFYDTNVKPSAEIIAYNGNTRTNTSEANEAIATKYKLTDKGYSNVSLAGPAELFYCSKPYMLSEVVANVCDVNEGANALDVSVCIYKVKVDEDGSIASIGDMICTATNDQSTYTKGRQWQTLHFKDLKYTDPETGRKRDLVIDSDILVVLKPNNTTDQFAQYLFATADNSSQKSYYWENSTNYILVSAQKDGANYIIPISMGSAYYLDDNRTQIGFSKAFSIQLGTERYWLHSEDGNYFAAADAGESKKFNFDTYYSTGAWSIGDENGDELPDWVTYALEDVSTSEGFTGESSVTFTVAPLPTGTKSRECKVNISYACCSYDITIHQGEGGVETAVADNGAKVSVEGNNFVVTASTDVNYAEVYNVAGQKVAEAAVAGNATIDASALANGVYIVKFNNGKAVKVVK